MAKQGAHPAFFIVHCLIMDNPAFFAKLPGNSLIASVYRHIYRRHLRLFFKFINHVKNRMGNIQLNKLTVRIDTFKIPLQVIECIVAPEVINEYKAAVIHILFGAFYFFIGQIHLTRFNYIEKRVIYNFRVGKIDYHGVGINFNGSHLLQAVAEVQVTVRIICCPAIPPAPGRIPQPGKNKNIFIEFFGVFPLGNFIAAFIK